MVRFRQIRTQREGGAAVREGIPALTGEGSLKKDRLEMKVSRVEVEAAINNAPTKASRIEILGALLSRATNQQVIIVGGSAVEVHTSGQTSSADIDIVTPIQSAAKVIESWGFLRSKGKVWRRGDWNIDIDLLGDNLTGSRLKLHRRVTPYGTVYLLGVEDLLVKRLAELKHWPETDSKWRHDLQRQVRVLLSDFGDRLDEPYLAFIARRDDVTDILGDFRKHSRPRPPRA
jgi:hypothetical protein